MGGAVDRAGRVGARGRPAWQLAISFSARKHRHQTRRDGLTPYFAHPVRVAFTVADLFGCEDEACLCAAVLHDTIEDTLTDYDELAEHFGEVVASLVAALTKNMSLPKARREEEYDRRLGGADWRARLVKLADAYDNLCDSETMPAGLARMKLGDAQDRAERAMALARADGERACVARALRVVGEELARSRRGSGATGGAARPRRSGAPSSRARRG